MSTLTNNFGWIKPGVNDPVDEDQWGTQLNSNLDSQDGLIHNITVSGINSSPPSYRQAGTLWIDNIINPWIVNIYDGAQDVPVGTLDSVTHEFTPSNGVILTTKGDLITYDGSENVRLGVGTNGRVLVSDSTQPYGIAWEASAGTLGAWMAVSITSASPFIYTLDASYNIASLTRSAQGRYLVTFNTALPSANYVVAGTGGRVNNNLTAIISIPFSGTFTSTQCSIVFTSGGNTTIDPNNFNLVFIGG